MNFVKRSQNALLLVGGDGIVCGRSAAHLLQLDLEEPEVVDVLVPYSTKRPELPGIRVRRTKAEGRRPPVAQPVPHTDIIDTVLDLGDHTDPGTCLFWLTESTRRGLVTMDALSAALNERNRHRHRALIRDICVDVASGATSNLEVWYARSVERAHHLPKAERQFLVPETGHHADFAYPQIKLLIECDGLAYHSGERAVRDAALDAEHAAAGYLTVRYRWSQVVGDPCAVAYEVARLLRGAGLEAVVEPCRREVEA